MLLYQKIMNQLVWEIKAGKYPAGSAMPCERELAKRFGTSQKTIHNAIKNMVRRGFIESRHGSGNFVLEHQRRLQESLAVVMNCAGGRDRDYFLSSEGFMEQISIINAYAKGYGVSTELLMYDEKEPLDDSVFEFCKTRHFINLFFTANGQMAQKIAERGGVMISTIQSFHQKHFAEMYDIPMPMVLHDYSSGIVKAFNYYVKQGRRDFAFFSQCESGRDNYSIFRGEAEKLGLELREFNYPIFKSDRIFHYSAKRVRFFRNILRELQPGTVIFADGESHISELLNSFHDEADAAILKNLHFCIVGSREMMDFDSSFANISWIPRLHPEHVKVATQLLLDNMFEDKELPESTVLESSFIPAEVK